MSLKRIILEYNFKMHYIVTFLIGSIILKKRLIMKKIVLLNPAISSFNLGDHIIYDSVSRELKNLLDDSFIVEVSTHLPVSKWLKKTKDFDLSFVCGSNLLRGKMNSSFRQWDINLHSVKYIRPSILMGVGWWQYGDDPNLYTKYLYKRVLSSTEIHSVRDSYTLTQLEKLGYTNVLNTACPTMWRLDRNHCSTIPQHQSNDVVFTLTDYNQDLVQDTLMIEILISCYKNVFFWPQGSNDLVYFRSLKVDQSKVKIINPSLKDYDSILKSRIDYVGTRLHAGIRALQHQRRAIIIGIDNRAIEKQKDFNIVCIRRDMIGSKLKSKITSSFATEIEIPSENIKIWKKQFKLT